MAFVTINTSEVAVGNKISSTLMTNIINNLNDLDSRTLGTDIETVTSNNTINDRSTKLTQLGDTSSGAFTTTLPVAGDNAGLELIFKKITSDGYGFTVEAVGLDQIEGETSQILTEENEVIWIQSDGSNWKLLAQLSGETTFVNTTRLIQTTSPITGGGDLSSDLTLELELSDGYMWVGGAADAPVETKNPPGVAPVGAIIPISDNLTGAYSVPASGTVQDGWMLCDGSAIPGGNTLSGNVPDLSDNRFLMGASTSGTTGGSNSITPTGTVSQPTFSGNSTAYSTWFSSSTVGLHARLQWNNSINQITASVISVPTWTDNQGASVSSVFNTSTDNYSEGTQVVKNSNGSYPTGNDFAESGNYTPSGTVSQPTFSGDSFNNRPQYLAVKYLIRVN